MNIIPKKKFTWLVLAVLAYGYYVTIQKDKVIEAEMKAKSGNVEVKPANEKSGFLEGPFNYVLGEIRKTSTGKAAVDAAIQQSIKDKYGQKDISTATAEKENKLITMDSVKGAGQTALCGSIVTISYNAYVDGVVQFDSADKNSPVTLKIGEGQVIKGLEDGLVGMENGSKRKIAIPSSMGFDGVKFRNDMVKAGKPLLYDIEMLNVSNGLEISNIISSMDKVTGEGAAEAVCGGTVAIEYKVFDKNNVTGEGELEFKIGDGKVLAGIENGIIGMKKGGVRNLSVPKSMLKTIGTSIMPEDLKIPEGETVVFEITLKEIK